MRKVGALISHEQTSNTESASDTGFIQRALQNGMQ